MADLVATLLRAIEQAEAARVPWLARSLRDDLRVLEQWLGQDDL